MLPTSSPLHDVVDFKVAGYACNSKKQIRLPDLIRAFQETALQSTLRLKVSVFDLAPLHLGWVLLGQYIKLNRAPGINESCTIVTCPTGFERVFTYRDFHLLDAEGQSIGTASTTWMLMDLRTRRMAQLPDWIKILGEQTPPSTEQLDRAPYRLILPTDGQPIQDFRVGYHHLDVNGHLTNPVYVEWMLEGLPPTHFSTHILAELNVQYKLEARYGETVTVHLQQMDDLRYLHSLEANGKVLATMQTRWGEDGEDK
ncbi:MAG: acyl-ACP thioesterase domain-containing protein [Bacteroidota bacterium]